MSPVTELHEPHVREERKEVQQALPRPATAEQFERPLFAQSLLEADSSTKRQRRWAATSSIALQCLVVGILLVIPLMFTEALPKQQLLTFLIAPPPPPPPPPAAAPVPVKVVRQIQSDLLDGRLRAPDRIPQTVQMIKEEAAPPPLVSGGGVVGGVPGGIPGGQLGGVIGGIISSTSHMAAPKLAPPEAPKRIRISQGVSKGQRIFSPEPRYPTIAQSARVQGDVILTAIISSTGEIKNLTVVSGHPLLVPAALQAVQQWRYRPFLLNGQPIEVETTITVTFRFSY